MDAADFMKRITVVLAEDNQVVRKEFRGLLEGEEDLEVVGEAKDGRRAVAMVKRLHPDVVLMDIAMPLLNGFEATREILKAVPATKVVMLSAYGEDAYVEEATRCGAIGHLVKHTCMADLCGAIRKVENGQAFYSPSIPSHLRKRNGKKQMD